MEEGGTKVKDDDIDRRFEGRATLNNLLTHSGSLADTEDVVAAFQTAAKDGVPAAVVIQALWEDEPRFESPAHAERLFGNLLALFELVGSGVELDLTEQAAAPAKAVKAPRPAPFGDGEPDDDFVEAAWRYFDDAPKERERLGHSFDNRHDALAQWLDLQGLDDDAFVLAVALVSDVHAMLELGGRNTRAVREGDIPETPALPAALAQWIDEGVFEAEQHEQVPLSQAKAEQVRVLASRAASALWRGSQG